jgi:hypothetical protein
VSDDNTYSIESYYYYIYKSQENNAKEFTINKGTLEETIQIPMKVGKEKGKTWL